MKKKIMIGLMIAAIGCSFVGCGETDCKYTNEEGVQTPSVLKEINENLSYDTSTNIVYYFYSWKDSSFMSPYISKDGTYCKYENGKVVPLEKGE